VAIERPDGAALVNNRFPAFVGFDGHKETVGEVRQWLLETDDRLRMASPVGPVAGSARRLVDLRARLKFLSRGLRLLRQSQLRGRAAQQQQA